MMKKFKVRTPSGSSVLRHKKAKTKSLKCANCGSPLFGVKRLSIVEARKLAASEKRTNRKFGGSLCAGCAKEILMERARNI